MIAYLENEPIHMLPEIVCELIYPQPQAVEAVDPNEASAGEARTPPSVNDVPPSPTPDDDR